MQLFHIISIVVPLAIAFILPRYINTPEAGALNNRAILYVACSLFFISWYLPSPLIEGKDTSFVTHFIGGGVFCAFLFLYIYQALKIKWSLQVRLMVVFALVSSLGVVNELFEFVLVKLDIASILLTDTSWDLVANTSGAFIAWVIIEVIYRDSWHR
ncbi:MAG TPA: hypothetical protein VGE13_01390 [Candidatus Saccharimonadales bacterium]